MKNILETVWKSLLVGAAYTVALIISGTVVSLAGWSLPEVQNAQGTLIWTFAGGIIVGLFLGPIAASIPISTRRHVIVWSSIVLFNLVSVAIEGYFFAPSLIGDSLPALILQQILTAFVTGWVITMLFAPKDTSVTVPSSPRSPFSWSWRFILSALSYVIFYFIFGALNYELVTRPYYEAHAGALTVPSPDVVLIAELIRSVLIVISVLPFLLTLRAGKRRLVLLTGLILFSIGGLVPLTMQASTLPFLLLAASAVEILFQNFSTGAVTAWLLGQSK